MLHKHQNTASTEVGTSSNETIDAAAAIVDKLSFSSIPGRFWSTRTFRSPDHIIHLGEEMEQRQRGCTLVIPNGPDAAVFEVMNNSPFSGFQYYIKDVKAAHPTVVSKAFLGEPNFSVADIPVGRFGYVKEINQANIVTPTLEEEALISLGGLTPEQEAEMHLVDNALHAIHPQSLAA